MANQFPLLYYLFFQYNSFFIWRDALEILFFSAIVYYFSLWLARDTHKNLLGYFYLYCVGIFTAHALNLTSVSRILSVSAPAVLLLFIIFHQFTLQKNFVTLQSIIPTKKDTIDWLEILIQRSLNAIGNNKPIFIAIQVNDALDQHLTKPISVDAPITNDILQVMLTSNTFDNTHMIWVQVPGNLIAINAEWQLEQKETWDKTALFFSNKCDALFITINPDNRLFTMIADGKQFTDITARTTYKMITKYLKEVYNSDKTRGVPYAHATQRSPLQKNNNQSSH